MRAEFNIIRKDWSEHQRMVALFTFAFQASILASGRLGDFAKGAGAGILFSGSYAFAQLCFVSDRRRGMLDTLLGLPIRPRNVILAKYCSAYSMALFLVNVPGVFLFDMPTVLFSNAAVLFLTTLCMTPSVLFNDPRAADFPLVLAFLALLPADQYGSSTTLAHYYTPIAIAALLISPAIAILAAIVFEQKSLR